MAVRDSFMVSGRWWFVVRRVQLEGCAVLVSVQGGGASVFLVRLLWVWSAWWLVSEWFAAKEVEGVEKSPRIG